MQRSCETHFPITLIDHIIQDLLFRALRRLLSLLYNLIHILLLCFPWFVLRWVKSPTTSGSVRNGNFQGRIVLGNRRARLLAFAYALIIHILIFLALYNAAHFQRSADEAESSCLLRWVAVLNASPSVLISCRSFSEPESYSINLLITIIWYTYIYCCFQPFWMRRKMNFFISVNRIAHVL